MDLCCWIMHISRVNDTNLCLVLRDWRPESKWAAITNIWCFHSISLCPVVCSVCCVTPEEARVDTGQAGRAENQRPVWGSSYQQRDTECCRMVTQQIIIFVDWDKALWHFACVCTSWCCHWNAILFRLVSVHCTPHSASWALLLSPTSGVRLHVSLVK